MPRVGWRPHLLQDAPGADVTLARVDRRRTADKTAAAANARGITLQDH
jgi:hypothetical protein